MLRDKSKIYISNITRADLTICEKADSFLQSAMWGRFKSRFGWEARAFVVEWADGGEKPLLTLSRRIAPGVVMAYIPWGPELPENWEQRTEERGSDICAVSDPHAALTELACALRPRLRGAAFVRFDPPWCNTGTGDHNFKRAAADIQPPDTVLVDLSLSEQAILAAMKPKWRYNIALAEKRGVTVNDIGERGLDVFYRLLGETAARDGIAIHNVEYYRALFEECGKEDANGPVPLKLRLYTAEHEGGALAALAALFRGKQATYLYGASANIKRNLMAPYALQWRAMRDAKTFGCSEYDLFGIPPDESPDHPMAGLYRFKTGFGGRIIHRSGSWDYPCKAALYALFSSAEYLRKKIRDRRKRKIRNEG